MSWIVLYMNIAELVFEDWSHTDTVWGRQAGPLLTGQSPGGACRQLFLGSVPPDCSLVWQNNTWVKVQQAGGRRQWEGGRRERKGGNSLETVGERHLQQKGSRRRRQEESRRRKLADIILDILVGCNRGEKVPVDEGVECGMDCGQVFGYHTEPELELEKEQM